MGFLWGEEGEGRKVWEGEKFVLGTFLWVKAVGTHFISQPRVIVHQQLVTLTLDVNTSETQFSCFQLFTAVVRHSQVKPFDITSYRETC